MNEAATAVIWRMRGQGKGNEMRVISVERENGPTTNLLWRLIRCIRVVVVRVLVGSWRWRRFHRRAREIALLLERWGRCGGVEGK